jgi:multidrug efflux pump subunit AcrA (membrane-fusion protein)
MFLRHILHSFLIIFFVAACGKSPETAVVLPPLMITPEDLIIVTSKTLGSGPVITGTIQPERRADLRAEVSAVVLQVLKENGDLVRRGDLLVRMDDTSIRLKFSRRIGARIGTVLRSITTSVRTTKDLACFRHDSGNSARRCRNPP